MKKILIILTNTRYYGNSKDKTGLWLAEVAEFVYKVQEHGYQVDYASVNGGEVPLDPRSLKVLIVLKRLMKFIILMIFKIAL